METFNQFVTELKLLVRDCNFDRSKEMVRDRIEIGVNHNIREKLINIGSNITWQKYIDIARLHEQFTAQARQKSSEDTSEHVKRSKAMSKQSNLGNPQKRTKLIPHASLSVYTHSDLYLRPKSWSFCEKESFKGKVSESCQCLWYWKSISRILWHRLVLISIRWIQRKVNPLKLTINRYVFS